MEVQSRSARSHRRFHESLPEAGIVRIFEQAGPLVFGCVYRHRLIRVKPQGQVGIGQANTEGFMLRSIRL
jgi:hypothetical protein